jgi:hypothetical protein
VAIGGGGGDGDPGGESGAAGSSGAEAGGLEKLVPPNRLPGTLAYREAGDAGSTGAGAAGLAADGAARLEGSGRLAAAVGS